MRLIIKHILVELFKLFHFVVLHALKLCLTPNGTYSLSNQLLNTNWNILVYKVLHRLYFVHLYVSILVNFIELALNRLFLLLKV